MNLEIANNLVKAAEGDDEIYKDAIFCLSSAKFLRSTRTHHLSLTIVLHNLKALIKLVRRTLEQIEKVKQKTV